MDERLGETLLLLPENSFEKGLIAGISDKKVIEGFAKRIKRIEMTDIHGLGHVERSSFDVAVSFFEAAPDAGQVRNIFEAVRPGGTVIVVMPSGYLRLPLISRVYPGARVYGLSPSLDDPRLAVPIGNSACAAASLALYQPSRRKAKLRRIVAYYLARLGFATVWARGLMLVWRTESADTVSGLPSLLRERFGEEIELALFTGTPGYLRKSTIQVMHPSGTVLGYCKIGANEETRAVVANEARILELLSDIDIGTAAVPELVFSGSLQDGTVVLLQSTRKKHLSSAPLVPGAAHRDFLARLFRETRKERGFRESVAYREMSARLPMVERHVDETLVRDLSDVFAWSSGIMQDKGIPLCLAHRDFTPWNTFLAEDRLYVFDWEFARTDWVPFGDAFHFVLQKGILVDHTQENLLWEKLTADATLEGKFLRDLVASIGVGEDVYYSLLALYLVDIVTTYVLHQNRYGQTSKDGQELLGCWKAILARLVKTKRIVPLQQ